METASVITTQMLLRESDSLAALSGAVVRFYRPLGLVEPVRLAPAIPFGSVGMLWAPDSENTILTHMLDALKIESKTL